jgi:hypothetical protein
MASNRKSSFGLEEGRLGYPSETDPSYGAFFRRTIQFRNQILLYTVQPLSLMISSIKCSDERLVATKRTTHSFQLPSGLTEKKVFEERPTIASITPELPLVHSSVRDSRMGEGLDAIESSILPLLACCGVFQKAR